jgi:hypothetical protein
MNAYAGGRCDCCVASARKNRTRQLRQRNGHRPKTSWMTTHTPSCSERRMSLEPHLGHCGGCFALGSFLNIRS